MNVQTITESQESAKLKLTSYRAQLHRRADEEYESIAKGYEMLAKGLPLIDLGVVMRDAECDQHGRPNLAIARADRRQVEFASELGRGPGALRHASAATALDLTPYHRGPPTARSQSTGLCPCATGAR